MGQKLSTGARVVAGAATGMVGGAALGGYLGAEAAMAGKPTQNEGKDTKLLKMELKLENNVENKMTAMCAAISHWVYTYGVRLVEIKDSNDNGAAAYRYAPDFDTTEVGYIPDGRLVSFIDEGTTDEGESWYQVRYLTMAVYVKKKHCLIRDSPAVHECEDAVMKLFQEKGLSDGVTIERARFLNAGTLSPSVATVLIQWNPGAGKPVEKILFVAWQGTQVDKRPMDAFTDLGAAPVRSLLWYEMCPDIWVHSGIYAKVQSDFLAYEKDIMQVAKEGMKPGSNQNCRIIFTGHSLGGGAALVAHMCALGVVDKIPDTKDLEHINLESVCFAAPMVFFIHNDKKKDERVQQVQEIFQQQSLNWVCDKDVVPRLPGYPDYYLPALKSMVKGAATSALSELTQVHQDAVAKYTGSMANRLSDMFLEGSSLASTFEELNKYTHISKIQYWKYDGTNLTHEPTVSLSTDGFTEVKEDDFKYILACHSFFPRHLTLSQQAM